VPASNEDRTVWALLDGDLANLPEIRADMERRGHRRPDVGAQEAVVHLYEQYGPACIHLLRGDLGLAVYDARRSRLWLARDPLGTRPLYYSISGGRLLFGSLLAPLLEASGVGREPDLAGLSAFLRAGFVPAPRTLFRDIRKLAPGQSLLVDESSIHVEAHWAPVLTDADRPVSATVAAEECARMLDEWVAARLPPEGQGMVLVDGGLGSALIATAAAKRFGDRVRALVVAFDDPASSSRFELARRVAGASGLDIMEHRLTPREAERILPEVVGRVAELPAVESLVLDEWACRSLPASARVLLRADGAAELFGDAERLAGPSPIGRLARRLFDGLHGRAGILALSGSESQALTAARFVSARTIVSREELASLAPELEPPAGQDEVQRAVEALMAGAGDDPPSRNLAAELGLVLPERDLGPVASVATARGVDVRWPFLDRLAVEAVSKLPPRFKAPGLRERSLLEGMAGTRLPGWMRRPGRSGGPVLFAPGRIPGLATDLLAPERLRRTGYFRPDAVARLLEEHRRGRPGLGRRLWALLGIQLWHALFVDRQCAT
jgi:asparagine synthase (glutamine-hydrolysing)